MGLSIFSSLKAYSSLVAALEARRSEGARFSEQRNFDREVGLEAASRANESERLYFWANKVLAEEQRAAAESYSTRVRAALLVVVLLGFVLGVGSSYLVFAYDGSAPVNILGVLLAFVFIPLLLLLLTLFVMLPGRIVGHITFLRDLREALQAISPGHIATLIASRLPSNLSEKIDLAFIETSKRQRIWGTVERYLILFAGQVFAVWYFLGVLSASMYQVVTSDLAFGWSTTLEVEAAELQKVTEALSTPWGAMAPHAVPRLELLRVSRFFRLGDGLPTGADGKTVDPAVLGEWWPFLLLAIACYGLFPRLLLYAFLRGKLRSVISRAANLLPGADLVLQNMSSAIVSTAQDSTFDESRLGEEESLQTVATELPVGSCVIVRWAGNVEEHETLRQQFRSEGLLVHEIFRAGGRVSLAEESKLPRLVSTVDSSNAILFVANAWEPPTAELLDFLSELRLELGNGRSVFVYPLVKQGTSYSPDVWRRALGSLKDPWLILLTTNTEKAE